MEYYIDKQAGVSNYGNINQMKQLMIRAKRGEDLTIAFLGGSITQGCLASDPKLCYAARVFDWWEKTFPQAEFTYINAGIGGTTSQFGNARVQEDVLNYAPDLVFVEFSVNDDSTEFFLETYEGLVRKILSDEKNPAVMLVHNVRYDDGGNAQVQHAKVARHYDLPGVSMQSSIYPQVVGGVIPNRAITEDDLHPNDTGHALVAEVITYFLQQILDETDTELEMCIEENAQAKLPSPITANRYEQAVRCQNTYEPVWTNGFVADHTPQDGITDVFKNGWTATQPGASIQFEIEGTGIAIQYRKSVKKPAPIAKVVVDGDNERAVILDANFNEDWGDCLYIDTVLYHGQNRLHHVEITLTYDVPDAKVPFYLVSVIGSN